jgi:hypothetical protein
VIVRTKDGKYKAGDKTAPLDFLGVKKEAAGPQAGRVSCYEACGEHGDPENQGGVFPLQIYMGCILVVIQQIIPGFRFVGITVILAAENW